MFLESEPIKILIRYNMGCFNFKCIYQIIFYQYFKGSLSRNMVSYLNLKCVELHSGVYKYLMRHFIGDGEIGTRPGYEFRRYT